MIGNESVPNLFHIFSGEPCPGKKACFDSIMKYWMLSRDYLLTAGELKKDECHYLKSFTTITHMKGLSSEVQACNIHFNAESGIEGKIEFSSLLKE